MLQVEYVYWEEVFVMEKRETNCIRVFRTCEGGSGGYVFPECFFRNLVM